MAFNTFTPTQDVQTYHCRIGSEDFKLEVSPGLVRLFDLYLSLFGWRGSNQEEYSTPEEMINALLKLYGLVVAKYINKLEHEKEMWQGRSKRKWRRKK